jgi:hypothetical protein
MKKSSTFALLFILTCVLAFLLLMVSACVPPVVQTPTQTPLPPTVTRTLSSSPTATFTPTTTPVPSGPCDNPLVPLVTGSIYEYRVTGSAEPALFTFKVNDRKDIGNINIEVQIIDHKNAWEIQELVICQEGEIVNFPLYVMSMLMVDYFKGILNTYHYHETAPYAPAYGVLAESGWIYAWEPGYQLEENVMLANPMGGANLALSGMSPIDVKFQMEGKWDTVEVPAGVYPEALQVKVDYHMVATIIQEAAGCSVDLHTTQWYVPFLGLVRAQIDTTEMKYMGQIFPADIASLLELIEFTPGP